MIKVGMGNQYRIDWRQIAHAQSWASEPLQNKNPLREVRVNHDVFSADLQKETRVPDEGDTQLSTVHQYRLARLAAARSKDGTAYQCSYLFSFTSDCDSRHLSLLDAGGALRDATPPAQPYEEVP